MTMTMIHAGQMTPKIQTMTILRAGPPQLDDNLHQLDGQLPREDLHSGRRRPVGQRDRRQAR